MLERKDFFEALFEYAEGNIEVRCLPNRKQEFFPHERKERLLEFVSQNLTQNVFFGVSTRNGGGKKEHIVNIPACWTDLDFKDTTQGAIEGKLKAFPLKPTSIVNSGGGYHIYWKFKEAHTLEDVDKIETLNHQLAQYWGGDHNACDASRILRVPGTFNYKYDPKREVKLVHQNGAEYLLEDFEFLPPYEKPPTVTSHGSTQNNTKDITTVMLCSFMQHCKEHAHVLSEPEWYAMITQLARMPGGRDYIHLLSKPYPNYSARETDEKILHAVNGPGPITCQRIKHLCDCGKSCPVKAPAALRFKQQLVTPPQPDKTVFPMFAIGGIAGEFANLYSSYLEPAKEFFYFAFLTCMGSILANRLTLASEIRPQPRLYTILLGESADDRKSTAITKTLDLFKETLRDFHVCFGVGSAEGLQSRLNDCSPDNLLLVFDELKAFVSKCKIEASVLLPCVNTLFESNRYQSRTKTTDILLEDAYLSILGASTIQTYENMWSTQFTDIGFNNRLLIIPASGERKHPIPKNIPLQEKQSIKGKITEALQLVANSSAIDIAPDARDLFDGWYMSLERSIHSKRLDTYALRLMSLLAINEAKIVVRENIVYKVIAIMDWQLAVRKRYDPIDADNVVARMETRIRRSLNTQPRGNRDLKRSCNVSRYGLWLFDTALRNLQRANEIYHDKKTQTWRME